MRRRRPPRGAGLGHGHRQRGPGGPRRTAGTHPSWRASPHASRLACSRRCTSRRQPRPATRSRWRSWSGRVGRSPWASSPSSTSSARTLVILGGGITLAWGDRLLEPARQAVAEMAFRIPAQRVRIVPRGARRRRRAHRHGATRRIGPAWPHRPERPSECGRRPCGRSYRAPGTRRSPWATLADRPIHLTPAPAREEDGQGTTARRAP